MPSPAPSFHQWLNFPASPPTRRTISSSPSILSLISGSSSFLASDGFFFTTAPHFSFSPIFNPSSTITSPLRFARMDPLLRIFRSGSKSNLQFTVVEGVRLLGGRPFTIRTLIFRSSIRHCPRIDPESPRALSLPLCSKVSYTFSEVTTS
ncbi:F-box/kelch-repeat protein, partial [Cucurbita argyrosperma subsp. sororia]